LADSFFGPKVGTFWWVFLLGLSLCLVSFFGPVSFWCPWQLGVLLRLWHYAAGMFLFVGTATVMLCFFGRKALETADVLLVFLV